MDRNFITQLEVDYEGYKNYCQSIINKKHKQFNYAELDNDFIERAIKITFNTELNVIKHYVDKHDKPIESMVRILHYDFKNKASLLKSIKNLICKIYRYEYMHSFDVDSIKGYMEKNLRKHLEKIPKSSGLYIFYNKDKEIIYIGKSKNLYKRIASSFRERLDIIPSESKVCFNSNIRYFSYIQLNNAECQILEPYFIVKYKPLLNQEFNVEEDISFDIPVRLDHKHLDIGLNEAQFNNMFFVKSKKLIIDKFAKDMSFIHKYQLLHKISNHKPFNRLLWSKIQDCKSILYVLKMTANYDYIGSKNIDKVFEQILDFIKEEED